jgi:hypothetical protein
MDFNPTLLMLSVIPSGIGFVLFMYGRKSDRWPQLVTGILFMVYPYFTGSTTSMVSVGVLLGAMLYLMVQVGW